MTRISLALIILGIWLGLLLTEHILPDISAVFIIIALCIAYGFLQAIAMIHQKRLSLKNPPPTLESTGYLPKVSIVVPAHNEGLVIEQTIHTLMKMDYPNYELLVMDDRSTDNTPEILQKLQAVYKDRGFKYKIRSLGSQPGKSAVLNEALLETSGEIIAVFDADAIVFPDFLQKTVPLMAEEGIAAVQARKVISNASTNLLTRCQNYEYSLDAYFQSGRDAVKGAAELRGNGQLVKRTALHSVGGWTVHTLTDDLDLSSKLHLAGWDIRFAAKVPVYEEGIPEFRPLIRQRRRWGEGALRRYLDYGWRVLLSREISLRTLADMLAYLVEFFLPLLIVTEYSFLLVRFLIDGTITAHLLTTLIIGPTLIVYFSSCLFIAILRFNKRSIFKSFLGALMTGTYIVFIWNFVVFWVMVKVLLNKERDLTWEKTVHYGTSALN